MYSLQFSDCDNRFVGKMNDFIKHQGIVERIENQRIYVRVKQMTSCNECRAVAVCLAADKKEKIIEIDDRSGSFVINDNVFVSVKQSNGFFAVFIAFVIPLALVILGVVAGKVISGDEAVGGLAGLVMLVPYYFVLYLFRNKLKKKFIFTLAKNDEFHPSSTIIINHYQCT